LANGTRYGLQAGIFTSDIKRALHAAQALEFGGVTVNEVPTFRSDQMPYGGVKDSGNTREGPRYAVPEMTERAPRRNRPVNEHPCGTVVRSPPIGLDRITGENGKV